MRLGAFELIAPLGEGGMGAVWTGRHVVEGIDVAIKVMHEEMMGKSAYRDAFATEVRSVAALDHRHIVTILDFGTVDAAVAAASEALVVESPYLVMELARGGSVEDYFSRLNWPDIRQLLLIILDALAHGHARKVIHRDLKPENILVGCGPHWDVKLTDFGLAHAADHFEDGKVETAWGTPQYMAPEQLRGLWREYGPWTDIYALGCMAFELVSGRWPYDGDTVWEIGEGHLEKSIPPLNPRFQVPAGVEQWVKRCMAKRRRDRFQSAADAAYHLAQLESLEDIQPFGVLFEPPDKSSTPDVSATATSVVAATQVMPELERSQGEGREKKTQVGLEHAGASMAEDRVAQWERSRPPIPLDWCRGTAGEISNELMGISLSLFGLRSVPMIGREVERDWLWTRLRKVKEQGRARQSVLEGEAGVGKTKLARWLARRAEEVGAARVLRASHSPVRSTNDGLVAMLERKLRCRHLEGKERRDHLVKFLSAEGLAGRVDIRMVLALFGEGDEPSTESGACLGREERYSVIYQMLVGLAQQRPVLLILDDLQWGRDALGFARYLEARQALDPAPIMVVSTVRREALSDECSIESGIAEHVASPAVERLMIDQLDQASMQSLVKRLLRLNEELADHVIQRSGGVPLFAIQLVEDWVARGKLQMTSQGFSLRRGADISIPDDLHELWESRIRGFLETRKPEARRHLEVAAALGQQVDDREWQQVIQRAQLPPLEGLVDQLVDEDLAFRDDDTWHFGHGMLRESLVRWAVEADRWKQWQRLCAESLEALHSPASGRRGLDRRMAWHWIQAGDVDRARPHLSAAIENAIWSADFGEAQELIQWRHEVVGDVDEVARSQDRIDRARLAANRGNYGEALQWADQALGMEPGASREVAAIREARLWKGVALRALGQLDEAQSALQSALNAFGERPSGSTAARILLEMGRVEEQRGHFKKALQFFERARAVYADEDNGFGQAQALNAIGDAHRRLRHYSEASEASLGALDLFQKLENVSGIADCLNDLSEMSRMRGDLEEAREFGEESLRLYRGLGSGEASFVALNLAMIDLEEDNYRRASQAFLEVAQAFKREGRRAMEARAKAGLLAANAQRGQWSGFRERLEQLEVLLEETGAYSPTISRALNLAHTGANEQGEIGIVARLERLAKAHQKVLGQ